MFDHLIPWRSHLYAPGNNPRILDKVFTANADAVILDLEDAVPPEEKARARSIVSERVSARAGKPNPSTFVRINHPAAGLAEEDVKAVVRSGLVGLRLPKVEDAETVKQIAAWVEQAENENGLPPGAVVLICLLESAAGVYRALEIATAHPRVIALGYGGADFERDLGVTSTADGAETLYARSHIVLASRLAGVRPPIDTVYLKLDDLPGLERSTRQARALGFFGRSAIHPSQVQIINTVFTPSDAEISRARELVEAMQNAESDGQGTLRLANGDFVDRAIVRRAQDVLQAAGRSSES